MWFPIILGGVVAVTLVLLVNPTPPPQTVDTVAVCIQKYWSGKPAEQWDNADDMDAVCRAVMSAAMEARNR